LPQITSRDAECYGRSQVELKKTTNEKYNGSATVESRRAAGGAIRAGAKLGRRRPKKLRVSFNSGKEGNQDARSDGSGVRLSQIQERGANGRGISYTTQANGHFLEINADKDQKGTTAGKSASMG